MARVALALLSLLVAGASAAAADYPCCLALGITSRLRWKPDVPGASTLQLLLETTLPDGAWLAVGPACALSRPMGAADTLAVGFDAGQPWAVDLYLQSYSPCTGISGVCPDTAFGGTSNVKLLSATRNGSVAAFALTRPMKASDGGGLDVELSWTAPVTLIWALGALSPGIQPPGYRLAQHGASDAVYGVLENVQLGSCPTNQHCDAQLAPPAAGDVVVPHESAAVHLRRRRAAAIAHGVLMTGAYAIGMPLCAATARYCRGALAWFLIHRGMAMGSVLLALGGLIAGIVSHGSVGLSQSSPHVRGAIATLVLSGSHVILAIVRPAPGTMRRPLWVAAHRVGGAAVLLLSGVALLTGPSELAALGIVATGQPLQLALALWAATLLVAALARESWALQVSKRCKAEASEEDRVATTTCTDARWARWVSGALLTAFCVALAVAVTGLRRQSVGGIVSSTGPPAADGPQAPPVDFKKYPDCSLAQPFERLRLGDGWCDASWPYNSAACGWDGGDCCNMSLPLFDCADPQSAAHGQRSPTGWRVPAPVNPRYADAGAGRVVSSQQLVTTFNNFYEFSTSKSVVPQVSSAAVEAMSFSQPGGQSWTLSVEGLVERPLLLNMSQLLSAVHVEQRVYRHRCVEAWSIAVPWVGFPLRKLLALAQPLPGARYVEFTSASNASLFPQQRKSPGGFGSAPWPYVEGIAIEEAWNDLTFLTVGLYDTLLPPQNGAPIRLTLPHKYGFKSAKSLVRVRLLAERPPTWWSTINAAEYGFWANVNPDVPHPRWSQADENALVSSSSGQGRIPTTLFNGYGPEVEHMYGTTREYFF